MVRVNYVRKETLSLQKVRQMCIDHSFYTRGTNEQYAKMFELCSKYSGNQDELVHIAWDIVDHSDMEELEDYGFDTVYEIVAFVMGEIVRNCIYISFEAIEKEVE